MKKSANKKIYVMAGPNGSGKTTTASSFFSTTNIEEFINADEIARGLSPMCPESVSLTASKLMLLRFGELLHSNKSFAFETTLSGKNYIKHLQKAQEKKYEISLIYLWLLDEELAIQRVAQRVAQGGHHITEEVVRRRYIQGARNLIQYYLPLVDRAIIINNSIAQSQKIIARKKTNNLQIDDFKSWKQINKVANG